MGATAAEIELDVSRQRQEIRARVARLRRRVSKDVDATRARTASHADAVKESLASAGGAAAEKARELVGTTAGSGSVVAEHPRILVASAAAGGLAFGLASGGSDTVRDEQDTVPGERKPGPQDSKVRLADAARGVIASQASRVAESFLASAGDALKSALAGERRAQSEPVRAPARVVRPRELGRGTAPPLDPVLNRDSA